LIIYGVTYGVTILLTVAAAIVRFRGAAAV